MTLTSKILLCSLLFIAKIAAVLPACATEINVKPGTSLTKIRDQVRTLPAAKRPATVTLQGGDYFLNEPLVFTTSDAGPSAKQPNIWKAAKGETVRLIGGKSVGGWKMLTNKVALAKLPEEARGKIYVVNLQQQGITDYGKLQSRGFAVSSRKSALEVFWQGHRLPVARYPNHGWLTLDKPAGEKSFTCNSPRISRWSKAPEAWLYGYWYHGWADQFLPLGSIDVAKKTVHLAQKHNYGLRAGQRFFVLNLLEELDAPGEWYLDRKSGLLYLYPPAKFDVSKEKVFVSTLEEPLLQLEKTQNLRIEGLTLEVCRGAGTTIRDCQNVTVADCVIRCTGGAGVSVNGGSQCAVESCVISHTGAGGISLNGGDRMTLTPGRHVATNNRIHNFGELERTYRPAISLRGVGNVASHNLIYGSPHFAISFGGNDHLIEYNEVHHVLQETDDAGAIYAGRDWAARGTTIRYNYLHHSGPQYKPQVPAALQKEASSDPTVVYNPLHRHGTTLIYFDDTLPQVHTYGNILHGSYRALLLGGGRDHTFENNVILGGNIGIWVDGRAMGWAKDKAKENGDWKIYAKLRKYPYQKPPYSTRYPRLPGLLEDEPAVPKGNVFRRNILVGVKKPTSFQNNADKYQTFEKNLFDVKLPIEADPLATLKKIPTDLKKKIGFEKIPIEKIGPQ